MKLAIVHGELVEQRAEELGDEEDEVDPHFLSSSFFKPRSKFGICK
jgi:hypothetical protein